VFLTVTAEESGLLGSEWYATNPIYPLSKTVANINIDGMVLMGRMRDVTVVGFGNSELEEYLERAAEKQDRYLEKEPTPEKGYFYRSDHFNFSKQGVPALFARGGIDSFEYGKEWGLARQTDYIRNRYHKPGDEFNPNWDWEGAVDDVLLYLDVGKELSNESTFPNWHEGNEFRPIRDRSRSSN
jgi:Zn-dependent M28 family amino/carboxypeptidase